MICMNQDVRIPLGLRARTLDFYVAFLVFFIGIYGIFDPTWPEKFEGYSYWIVLVEGIYLTIASLMIMLSLIVREKKKCRITVLIPSIVGEAFGWLFVSTASLAIALTSWLIPPTNVVDHNEYAIFIWFILWLGLAISSFLRSLDLKRHYKIRVIK